MIQKAKLFGFGSYFEGVERPADIDLLIVHEDTSADSCHFAISCKQLLRMAISAAHVTILSVGEESDQRFIERSTAIFLGPLHSENAQEEIERFAALLLRPFDRQLKLRIRHYQNLRRIAKSSSF
ncbi:hypothetical protein AB9F35_32265 [Rhizobium leguminosarum]|uniref:hypothetical protein n=1 Tax=Rhizobium leguminosarum TaxID=384 RepID=UPI003F9E0A2C